MQTARVRNLWLLSSGARPENILELMESDFNRVQLQNFKDDFDFVIIDSPPTLSLADAQILSALAEAVTLVVAESTPSDAVQRAQAVLRLTGSHVLGIILNNDKSGASFTAETSRALAPVGKIRARAHSAARWPLSFESKKRTASTCSALFRLFSPQMLHCGQLPIIISMRIALGLWRSWERA